MSGVVWRMDGGPLDEPFVDHMAQQALAVGYDSDLDVASPRDAGMWKTRDGRWLHPMCMDADHLFNTGLFVAGRGLDRERPDVQQIFAAFLDRFGCYP